MDKAVTITPKYKEVKKRLDIYFADKEEAPLQEVYKLVGRGNHCYVKLAFHTKDGFESDGKTLRKLK